MDDESDPTEDAEVSQYNGELDQRHLYRCTECGTYARDRRPPHCSCGSSPREFVRIREKEE